MSIETKAEELREFRALIDELELEFTRLRYELQLEEVNYWQLKQEALKKQPWLPQMMESGMKSVSIIPIRLPVGSTSSDESTVIPIHVEKREKITSNTVSHEENN